MTRNPIVNALTAAAYIVLVASGLYYGPKLIGPPAESVLFPIAFLCLFVLSAAVMGLVFFMQPVQLYLDGEKKQAWALLLRTVAAFAGVTALVVIIIVAKSRL
jgi:hypothetical protein